VQPLISGVIGWVRYGERLTAPDLAGAALIACAMILIRRDER
jgi:drug/metabolite transporter (DMT)-like permease